MNTPFVLLSKPSVNFGDDVFDREGMSLWEVNLSNKPQQILLEGITQKIEKLTLAMKMFDFIIAVDYRARIDPDIHAYLSVDTFYSDLLNNCTLYKLNLFDIFRFLTTYDLDTKPNNEQHGMTLLHNWLYITLKPDYGFLFERYAQRTNSRSQTFLLEKRR